MAKRGRPKKIGAEESAALRAIVREQPVITLGELATALRARTGTSAHPMTIAKALHELGFERTRPRDSHSGDSASEAVDVSDEPQRYGYTTAHRAEDSGACYPSSLTEAEWAQIADLFDATGGRGLPPRYSRRCMLDACCYVVRTGCAWRELPNDFPPWQNVYRTFRRWSAQGRFERMHDRLRAQWRAREGRADEPSAAVLDAQSTRHSPQGGPSGFDAGKKVKGRKRHVLVDTLGLVLAVSVSAASVQDRDGAHPVMSEAMAKYPNLQTIYADSGYAGRCAQTLRQDHGLNVRIVRHPRNAVVGSWASAEQPDLLADEAPVSGFEVQPKRWVVERTHAWIERFRRLVMHHDRRTDVAESWVWLARARQMLRPLTVAS